MKNIYPIYKSGKKVPIRKYGIRIGNNIVASDHVWTDLNREFLKVNTELKNGDIIDFDAVVSAYPIVRDDVQDKRNKIFNEMLTENDELYKEYITERNKLFKLTQEKAQQIYHNSLLHLDEKKLAQKQLWSLFKKQTHKMYHSMQAKQKRRIRKSTKIPLVDYGIANVKNVSIYKYQKTQNRIRYDVNRINDVRYTKYLAARSMESCE